MRASDPIGAEADSGSEAVPREGSRRLQEPRPAIATGAEGIARRLGTWTSVGRLHIVAIGALGTFTFGWLFTGRYPWLLAVASGLDWFLVNLLNRAVDLDEDRHNRIVGTELAARFRPAILVSGFGLLAASLAAFHLLAPEITPWRLGYHALGLAYNWPLLPGRKRIKQLYFWKNTASATGFAITCFAYPLAAAHWTLSQPVGAAGLTGDVSVATVVLALLFFLPFEVSYEILYDLRDAAGDRAAGLRTYPVVHGAAAAVWIINALLVTSMLVLIVGYAIGVVPWRLAIMAAAPLSQLVATHWALGRSRIDARFCIGITWLGAALLAVYHVWILLELPGARGWS